MKWLLIVLLIPAQLCSISVVGYQCNMRSLEVYCTGINSQQLPGQVSVILNKTNTVTLNITKGFIPTITPITFKNFTNLESLYISDSGVSNLEDGAFVENKELQDLLLKNNNLREFNVRSLSPENKLKMLDLSYNLLSDFNDFNISQFSNLNVLNVAHNFLSYLPVDLLKLLEQKSEFYLVAENNPWNCTEPRWSEYLTEELINIFCKGKAFNYMAKSQNQNYEELSTEKSEPNLDQHLFQPTEVEEQNHEQIACEKPNCSKCSFYYCLLWFVCGIWIGIILGNIGKIRALLCRRSVTYSDQYTQCEFSLVEQHMVSGVFDSKSHKLTPISMIGLSVQSKEKTGDQSGYKS